MLYTSYFKTSKRVVETHEWNISNINPNYIVNNSSIVSTSSIVSSIVFECKNCNILLVETDVAVVPNLKPQKYISLFESKTHDAIPVNFTCAAYLIHKVIC